MWLSARRWRSWRGIHAIRGEFDTTVFKPRRSSGRVDLSTACVQSSTRQRDRPPLRLVAVRLNAYDRSIVVRSTRILLCALALLCLPAAGRDAAPAGTRDVLVVGNNWDGTADIVDPHTFERADAAEHRPRPRRSAARRSSATRSRPASSPASTCSSARATTSTSTTRSPRTTGACSTSRGRASPTSSRSTSGRARSPGARRSTATAPTTWRSRPTAGGCSCRPRPRARSTSSTPPAARSSASSPPATSRTRTTSRPTASSSTTRASARSTRRWTRPSSTRPRATASSQVVDAGTLQILKRIDVGQSLAANGFGRLQLRGAADGAVAGRAHRLPAALVPARLRRVRPASATARCAIAHLPISAAGAGRCRARPTCWTPRTTASRSTRRARSSASPARCPTTRRSSHRDDFSTTIAATSAASRTGRRTAPTAATASCRSAATTGWRSISYADERRVATIRVGDHPQRMRTGVMRAEYLPPVADRDAPRITRRARRSRRAAPAPVGGRALRAVVQRARRRALAHAAPSCAVSSPRASAASSSAALRAARRHRVSLTASDAAGNRSARRVVRFAAAYSARW